MRRFADVLLLILQWALVLLGLALLLGGVQHWWLVDRVLADLRGSTEAVGDTYYLPVRLRLLQFLVPGFTQLGLGAVLFYLRHLYLRRLPRSEARHVHARPFR